jgi:hypothetical protein
MSSIPNDAVRDALACPQCAGALAISDGAVTCPHCAIAYHFNPGGQLDLRLKQPKSVEVSYTVGPQELPARDQLIHTIPPNPSPDHDWGNVSISKLLRHGNRLTPELLGYFPRAKQGGMMLDLGCGYGPIACALALRSPDAHVFGVDVNERALSLTRGNAEALGLTNVSAGTPDEIPEPPEQPTSVVGSTMEGLTGAHP